MHFLHSKWFKYLKNLVIGLGASVVLIGALYKILAWPNADLMLQIGLYTEAFLFAFLGVIGPEKDYYWEKLYPGLDKYNAKLEPLALSEGVSSLDGAKTEEQLGGMLGHLETMAGSLSSLKALQEVDFSGTSDQIKKMGTFYSNLNEAMANINDSVEDTRVYREQLTSLNGNLATTNEQMRMMSSVYATLNESAQNLSGSVEDTREYKQQLQALNQNLGSLNSVYGNILAAMNPGR